MLCHSICVILCHVVLYHVVLSQVMLCCIMLCCVTLCHVMLWYVMRIVESTLRRTQLWLECRNSNCDSKILLTLVIVNDFSSNISCQRGKSFETKLHYWPVACVCHSSYPALPSHVSLILYFLIICCYCATPLLTHTVAFLPYYSLGVDIIFLTPFTTVFLYFKACVVHPFFDVKNIPWFISIHVIYDFYYHIHHLQLSHICINK